MKKIILSLAIMAIVGTIVVGATRAYFTSSATSTGNTFAAGTMNLSLSAGDPTNHTVFTIANMAPGIEVGPQTLNYSNAGSIDGFVKLNTTYALTSGGAGLVNEHDFARHLIVTSGVTDGIPVQGWWAQHVIDSYSGADNTAKTAAALADRGVYQVSAGVYAPTVYGLSLVTLKFENGYNGAPVLWPAGAATHAVVLKLELDPTTTNEYQGAGISVSLNATMLQTNDTSF